RQMLNALGVNLDIDNYTIPMSRDSHQLEHLGWNQDVSRLVGIEPSKLDWNRAYEEDLSRAIADNGGRISNPIALEGAKQLMIDRGLGDRIEDFERWKRAPAVRPEAGPQPIPAQSAPAAPASEPAEHTELPAPDVGHDRAIGLAKLAIDMRNEAN